MDGQKRRVQSPQDKTPTTINGVKLDTNRLRAISPVTENVFKRNNVVMDNAFLNDFDSPTQASFVSSVEQIIPTRPSKLPVRISKTPTPTPKTPTPTPKTPTPNTPTPNTPTPNTPTPKTPTPKTPTPKTPTISTIPELPTHLRGIKSKVDKRNDDDTNNPYSKQEETTKHHRKIPTTPTQPVNNIRYIPPPTNIIHGYDMKKQIDYAIPDYYTMDVEERMSHLTQFINHYSKLRTIYPKMDIPKIRNNLEPMYLRLVYINYMGLVEQTTSNSNIDMYRFGVVMYLLVLEVIVTKYIGINVTGMSSKFYKSRWMVYYESAIHELCETGGTSMTDGWHPGAKILFYGVVQTLAFLMLKAVYSMIGPTAALMLEKFFTAFMGQSDTTENSALPIMNDETELPEVPAPSNMPNFGGLDINSIMTGLTGMFNQTQTGAAPTTQPEATPAKKRPGPRYRN